MKKNLIIKMNNNSNFKVIIRNVKKIKENGVVRC